MSEAGLKIAEADGIVEVTIDRPPVNALARSTYLEIAQVFSSFRDRPDVRVVILTAPGNARSALAGTSRTWASSVPRGRSRTWVTLTTSPARRSGRCGIVPCR